MFKLSIICFVSFLFVTTHVQGQIPPPPPPVVTDTTEEDESDSTDFDVEFKTVQVEAQFPGGRAGWISFLQKTLKVNTPVKHKAPSGVYIVEASFLVNKSGEVSEIKILKDPGYGCAEEVMRVLNKSPKWTPAEQNGKKVIYRQKQQVAFQVS